MANNVHKSQLVAKDVQVFLHSIQSNFSFSLFSWTLGYQDW